MVSEPSPRTDTTAASRQQLCASVSDSLAAAAGDDRAFGPAERDHLATCLRCRVERSRYRRMSDAMRTLRDAPVTEDSLLESQIRLHLDRYGQRTGTHSAPRVAATFAAGAAAAAGLIAFTARHRRAARLAS